MHDEVTLAKQAEDAVIGVLLHEPYRVDDLDLTGDMFLQTEFGEFYDLIADMRRGKKPCDLPAIVMHAKNTKARRIKAGLSDSNSLLAAIGGTGQLGELGNGVSRDTPRQLPIYADRIRKLSARRAIRSSFDSALRELEAMPIDEEPTNVLRKVEIGAYSSSATKSEFDFASMAELAARESGSNELLQGRLQYGYSKLDDMTGGLFPCELTIIAARPSIGKTALGLGIAWNVALSGKKVSIISCEMSEIDLGHRLLAMATGINIMKIRKGYLAAHEHHAIETAIPMVRKLKGRAWISGRPTVQQVFSRASIMQSSQGLDLLVVDHLGLLKSSNPRASQYERVTEVSMSLKELAQELHIPVLCLCQLNREAGKTDEPPKLEHLRDSGSIEQDANNVIFIHRQRGQSETVIGIPKQRQGPIGSFPMYFNEERCCFEDIEEETDNPFANDFSHKTRGGAKNG